MSSTTFASDADFNLQSVNRQNNRDFHANVQGPTGKYMSFFPDNDDALGDGRLSATLYPDFEPSPDHGRPVDSEYLFNVLKKVRPVVILDEAHKAYGIEGERKRRVRAIGQSSEPRHGHRTLGYAQRCQEQSGGCDRQRAARRGDDQAAGASDLIHERRLASHVGSSFHAKLEELQNEAVSLENSEGRYIEANCRGAGMNAPEPTSAFPVLSTLKM